MYLAEQFYKKILKK